MTEPEIHDITIQVLRSIRDEVAGMRQDMSTELGQVNQRLGRLEARFDNLLEFAGDRYREHEERIRACESGLEELRGKLTL